MDKEIMKRRTKQFAIDCGHLINSLPKNDINKNYSNQLIRSSGSVAANYRAVSRAKSTSDFINKLKIVEEEQDESLLWLELLVEFNKSKRSDFVNIYKEGEEILKIIVASIKTTKSK
ncbi:four helix bundle protein [Ferruginibacter lapsinanis]|uniref:four helix bundle protein n=1 Tax=Ferruginibacter lapsinanis TaxID=563172 RepID=UPI001E59C600|nr:four helix bundle protein [Ferruginibacter lapsinanis]UEG50828.1 four helix bundle protein [Ferruginibacter lapsinanis]